ncbi:uncharacterized protein LOC133174327 [Saccostrea echinata]|uniref:uncharacterized protein LOC133174327 n=1 Tax=Saccostrea echinata TaxID=191078 RepID=UPI002A7F4259|nr:uncharacterized protein LOC133174327 [Saccostrea echinata]
MSGTKEIKKEGRECQVYVLFIEDPHAKPIADLLANCRRYKEELRLDKELEEASLEYKFLLKKAGRTGSQKTTRPYELNLFNDERRCQAPSLFDVISKVSKRCQYAKWEKAMSEFIGLTPKQTEPKKQVFTADVYQVFAEDGKATKDDEESDRGKPPKFDKEEKGGEREEDSEDRDELSETLPPEINPDTEDQSLKSQDYQEEDKEEEVFHDAMDGETKDRAQVVNVLFLENQDKQPIENFLENCQRYKEELQLGEELTGARNEYKCLLKKAKETGCPVQKNAPPSQLNAVTPNEKCQAPSLYEVISDVSKRWPKAKWMDAVTEFITLTTYSQSEPRHAKHQRPRSASGYQKKKEKEYRNTIEKLLDQEWDYEVIPRTAVEYDYRHFYTSESVLKSSFPDAYIFNMANSTLSKPEDVPSEFKERTLFTFLLSIDMKKYGVKPADAWRDFGRCILAEKQLDLARRAVGPDLDKNVIVSKHNFYKLQNELKEKTEEIEELSTRLSKFASQQLTEGNPNIADLSDTHRPTRLGEMYSQLFDDEWSEAFEALKPKKDEDDEEEDDDIFPDTLFILQNMLKEIFEFCKTQSQKQLVELEDSFATVIGLKESKVRKQKNEERAEENHTDGGGDSSEKPKVSDESVQEKESKETDDTSDNKQFEDIKTPSEDIKGGDELFQQPKLSTESTEMEKDAGELNDNQTEKDKPGNSGTDTKDSSKEGAVEQPKPNKQDTSVTDPEKEPEKDTSNNINNDTELNNSMNVEDKPMETSDKKLKGEQTSDDKMADPSEPNLDRNEVPNEEVNSEGQTSEKTDDNASSKGQDKELLESSEQSNIKQSSGEETSKDGEKEDKQDPSEREEAQNKAPEEKDGGNEPDGEEEKGPEEEEDRKYRTDQAFPMIERHAREFRKAAAATSAKTKSTLFINVELPNLVTDKGIREDLRTLTYVRKCVELCWYMCMQDPPMVIISPERGQEIDKGLFSLHGRRGKTVEVCVWPALLLHDSGPLVCKGYVLPEERKRKK